MAIEANRVWNGSTLILRWTTCRLQEAGKSLIHLKNLQWGSRRRKPPTFYTSLSEFRGNTYPMVSQLTGSTWLHFRSFRSCHLMLTCHHHIFISRGYHPVTRLLGKMAARMHARDFGNKFWICRRGFYLKEIKNRLFHSFGLKDILLKRLKDMNIEKPTAIQEKVCLEFAGADYPTFNSVSSLFAFRLVL